MRLEIYLRIDRDYTAAVMKGRQEAKSMIVYRTRRKLNAENNQEHRTSSRIITRTNDVQDTTAATTLTFSLLPGYACDVHPRHNPAAVPA